MFNYYHQILFFPHLFMGISIRMEVPALRSSITQAKIMGTLVSISGALMLVFYKGPTIISIASQAPPPSTSFSIGLITNQMGHRWPFT